MSVEIEFAGGITATVSAGTVKTSAKGAAAGMKAVADRIGDSPSIPDLDHAKAVAIAEEFSGEVITPAVSPETIKGEVY